MLKGSKGKCESPSHKILKEKAKSLVEDLQGTFTNLQTARKQSQTYEVVILEEQLQHKIRELYSEFNEPSPASSSLLANSLGSFSEELARLLKCDEEDDATSPLKELPPLKPEPDPQNLHSSNLMAFTDEFFVSNEPQQDLFQGFDQCHTASSLQNTLVDNTDLTTQLKFDPFDFQENLSEGLIGANDIKQLEEEVVPNVLPDICPPASAFLGPKCALWDCSRPAKWSQNFCSTDHDILARHEGLPEKTPVLRPGGIALKDSSLFAALNAKTQGKDVGIPNCEGAAILKSPWNAPELFDLSFLEGETIREWLFFGKPRRAFESGNRKQRSLPDYNGRGWHESRKQVMEEFGGKKRSYYMDPQPSNDYEWHLFEYEVNNADLCALYRLELKFGSAKKSPRGKVSKGKVSSDPVADLQKKMGRLTAETPPTDDDSKNVKPAGTGSKNAEAGNVSSS